MKRGQLFVWSHGRDRVPTREKMRQPWLVPIGRDAWFYKVLYHIGVLSLDIKVSYANMTHSPTYLGQRKIMLPTFVIN